MNYNRPFKNSSTFSLRMMCATVFVVFSFCWLFFFQSDILMMGQHVLSKDLTHYNVIVGAIIITLVLQLMQLFIYSVFPLKKRTHALTYFPSILLLSVLSGIYVKDNGEGIGHTFSWWTIGLSVFVWLLAILLARVVDELEENSNYRLLSRPMWVNMLLMSLMFIFHACISNTNAVFHYRMKVERCLMEGNVDGALKIGKKSLESDAELTMLRMYALAQKGKLGEQLFEYPVKLTSGQILPTDSTTNMVMYPLDSLYRFMGARPAHRMSPIRYLNALKTKGLEKGKTVADYLLCGYLIDRQIDRFASEIQKYYALEDKMLPKHYREALTLYTHLRTQPVVIYHDAVMDEDYANLQELEKQYPSQTERKGKVEEHYRGTYWYYYSYDK